MIKARYGDRLDAWLKTALGPLLRLPIAPVWLSATGALLSCVAGGFLACGSLRIGALWIAAGACFDLIDGPVARAQGKTSDFGAFLDSTLDRVADLAIYLGVIVWFSRSASVAPVLLAGVAMATALLTSYIRARAEALGAALEGGAFERGERLGVLGFGALLGWLEPALWVLAIAGCVTVVTRFRRAHQLLTPRPRDGIEAAGSSPDSAADSSAGPSGGC